MVLLTWSIGPDVTHLPSFELARRTIPTNDTLYWNRTTIPQVRIAENPRKNSRRPANMDSTKKNGPGGGFNFVVANRRSPYSKLKRFSKTIAMGRTFLGTFTDFANWAAAVEFAEWRPPADQVDG